MLFNFFFFKTELFRRLLLTTNYKETILFFLYILNPLNILNHIFSPKTSSYFFGSLFWTFTFRVLRFLCPSLLGPLFFGLFTFWAPSISIFQSSPCFGPFIFRPKKPRKPKKIEHVQFNSCTKNNIFMHTISIKTQQSIKLIFWNIY